MIADRIRQARLAAGLTLAELGNQLGVSHTAIQKFEKGFLTPSSTQLLKLAQACGIRTEYFFRTRNVTLLNAEFRKRTTFGKTAQESIKLKVVEMVEKRMELLSSFPNWPLPTFVSRQTLTVLPKRIKAIDEIDAFADKVRDCWQLGMNPIGDLTDTLEGLGLLVIVVDDDHPGFSGMTAMAQTQDGERHPIVAVSKRWPGDRQRFTLAHEVGHILLNGRLTADIDEEKACDRFAGSFLVPCTAVHHLLGDKRHALEWQELYTLKHDFGLSMAGWLARAKQCRVITDSIYLSTIKRFSARGWRRLEPGDPLPQEEPRLFHQLVYRALAEQYISEAKAAELLGIPLMRFHKQRQLESVNAATDQ
ncbi:MAG: XRE family transcriptional regulator [Burkholderiaceae bacterium]|nr:XRE family transcriptional regulator [Burkholderiaceae bacterium]MCD8537001.1 XRE family transcriptional regulator [Burkholderiaceae bacterium]